MKKLLIIIIVLLAIRSCYKLTNREVGDFNTAQNGISPVGFASDIFRKYDTNKNELLDVADESFLRTDVGEGVTKVESRGLLFTDADAFGDRDGQVTEAELIDFLSEFDTDGDGELTNYKNIFHSLFGSKSEGGRFAENYVEKYSYR